MATQQKGGYCPGCRAQRLGTKEVLGDGAGCIITLLTGGLFLLIWLPYRWFVERGRPYLCPVCGTKLKTG